MREKVDKIVELVISELRGRSGFDGVFDSLDEDIIEEIQTALTEQISEVLNGKSN